MPKWSPCQQVLNMMSGWVGRPPSQCQNCRSWTWGEKTPKGHSSPAHSWCRHVGHGAHHRSPWVWVRCTLWSSGWALTFEVRNSPIQVCLIVVQIENKDTTIGLPKDQEELSCLVCQIDMNTQPTKATEHEQRPAHSNGPAQSPRGPMLAHCSYFNSALNCNIWISL